MKSLKYMKFFVYLCALAVIVLLAKYIEQHRYFQIAQIDIVNERGSTEFQNANRQQIFQSVLPSLTGSFFSVNVHQAQKAAQATPWVAQAKVSRVSFSSIKIDVQEYHAVARWLNNGTEAGLVDSSGRIFQAPTEERLPEFDAPADELNTVMKQYHLLNGQLKSLRLEIERLKYDARGAWTMRLTNGVEVRLGKQDIHTRVQRLIQYWQSELSVLALYLDYVDMRYPHAFAVKFNADIPAEFNPLVRAEQTAADNTIQE